ncbi:E3 ubiquitin-protein ligase SIRP1-like [Tasmannia lanceolata]|uniref:E3 ubiquitin-protein ligase SIRP1-like n=1 Tax=Tasmannia lanceolata TaxID=3420 RepID=UPI004063245F
MGEALVARYWCHMCSQMVNPVIDVEITCPFCESGFVEEMNSSRREQESELGSDRALSLWAPILLGLMGGPHRRRSRRDEEEEENPQRDSDRERERDSESILRRRRRNSAAILQLLQSLRASESENSDGERDRERVILINPFNQAIILQGSFDLNENPNQNQNNSGSLGDYLIGPGLDLLLQHLADNDPNRYGTPPANKEAVEAMPNVIVKEDLQCSVCLEDFDIGSEAKEMPCKHKFHSGCILPWLELHSSCPVCRFQLPAEGSKDQNVNNNNRVENSVGGERVVEEESGNSNENGNGNGRRFWVPVTWPFSGLFSLSGSQSSGNSSSTSSSPSSSSSTPGSTHTDEN